MLTLTLFFRSAKSYTEVTGKEIKPEFCIGDNCSVQILGFLSLYNSIDATNPIRRYVGSSVTMYNVAFSKCYSLGQDMQEGSGGALYLQNSDTYLDKCNFGNNQAYIGGAISSVESNMIFNNGSVLNNQALKVAGGIFASKDTAEDVNQQYPIDIQLFGITFKNNEAAISFGAVSLSHISDAFISYCSFNQNSAHISGGAFGAYCCNIYFQNDQFASNSVIESSVRNESIGVGKRPLLFSRNKNNICYGGGALALRGDRNNSMESRRYSAYIEDCTFKTNVVDPVFGANVDVVAQGKIDVGFKGAKTSKQKFEDFVTKLDNDPRIGFESIYYNHLDGIVIPVPPTNKAPDKLPDVSKSSSTTFISIDVMIDPKYNESQPPSPSIKPNILFDPPMTTYNIYSVRKTNSKIRDITIKTYTIHPTLSPSPSPVATTVMSPKLSMTKSQTVSKYITHSVISTVISEVVRTVVTSYTASQTLTETKSFFAIDVNSDLLGGTTVSKSVIESETKKGMVVSSLVSYDTESVSYTSGYIYITIETETVIYSDFYIDPSESSEYVEGISAGLIIGLAAAGGMIVLIIAILAVWMYRKMNEQEDSSFTISSSTGDANNDENEADTKDILELDDESNKVTILGDELGADADVDWIL